MNVKLYVEGGGEPAMLDGQCRAGFRKFLEAAGLKGKMPRIVACGSRNDAFKLFEIAVRIRKGDELPLLLVDSEDAVDPRAGIWEHLQSRDHWNQPPGVSDDQVFLMVRCMETWLLADCATLAKHFGQYWNGNVIPAWPILEDVGKNKVFDALAAATAACDKRRYAKGRVSFELLAKISPTQVESACPHAKRFLDALRTH